MIRCSTRVVSAVASNAVCANPVRWRVGLQFYCSAHRPRQAVEVSVAELEAFEQARSAWQSVVAIPAGLAAPSPCDFVLYTLGNGPSKGQQRPALVIRRIENRPELLCPIVVWVYTDASIDGLEPHRSECAYAEEPRPWTWCYPGLVPRRPLHCTCTPVARGEVFPAAYALDPRCQIHGTHTNRCTCTDAVPTKPCPVHGLVGPDYPPEAT